MSSNTQLTQTRHVSELEATIRDLQHQLANEKQKNYGKDYIIKNATKKLEKVERDCKHIEAAFESYVNEVELDKLRDKIKQDMDEKYGEAMNTRSTAA
jgi:methyl coenzyme M reductase subunit C-like uncharacterized protein (methanogenesis marker protein 7)